MPNNNEALESKLEYILFNERLIRTQKMYPDNQTLINLSKEYENKLKGVKTIQEVEFLSNQFAMKIDEEYAKTRAMNRELAAFRSQLALFKSDLLFILSSSALEEEKKLALKYQEEVQRVKTPADFLALKTKYLSELESLRNNLKNHDFKLNQTKLASEIGSFLKELANNPSVNYNYRENLYLLKNKVLVASRAEQLKQYEQKFYELKTIVDSERKKDELLETAKADVLQEIKTVENTYSASKDYLALTSEYRDLVIKAKTTREVTSYLKSFLQQIDDMQKSKEAHQKSFVKAQKVAMRSLFANLCNAYIKNHPEDAYEANELFEDLAFYINSIEPSKFDDVLKQIVQIQFKDINADRRVFRELDPLIYINKKENDVVILRRKDEKNAYFYSKKRRLNFTMPNDKFDHMFISLKSFFKKATYVGNKKVQLKASDNRIRKVERPFQEFVWCYDKELMLALEDAHGEDQQEHFVFYPLAHYRNLFDQPYWSISVNPDKENISRSIAELADPDTAREKVTNSIIQEFMQPVYEYEETMKAPVSSADIMIK